VRALVFAAPVLVALDNDAAGQRASQRIVAAGPRFRAAPPPAGFKDLGEAYLAGVDLERWALEVISPTNPKGEELS
jgi:hypothetical protein